MLAGLQRTPEPLQASQALLPAYQFRWRQARFPEHHCWAVRSQVSGQLHAGRPQFHTLQ